MKTHIVAVVAVAVGLLSSRSPAEKAGSQITCETRATSVVVRARGRPLATYVYKDKKIRRPFFKDIHAPGGVRVSRHFPPRKGADPTDHADMHPGLWLAFGDLSGADFWRNKADVEHVALLPEPAKKGRSGFAVRNRYKAGDKVICEETCEYTFLVRPAGYLILWSSTFKSDRSDFYFGDQEEMGLGLRVTTPIMVNPHKGKKNTGRIIDDRGRRDEKGIWGREAAWCDYSGWIDKRFVGVTIMPAPRNVRPCRWHTRNYGFMAANPFGRKVFRAGALHKTVVRKGQPFRLAFGILIHAGDREDSVDLKAAYKDYLALLHRTNEKKPR